MIINWILSLCLILIILILIFKICFVVQRSKEHYRLCSKIPSIPRGYLSDFNFCRQICTLNTKAVMITVKELCADFKNHHRKRLAPKRYDCNATTQAEFTMHLFYRKEFKMVLDTLLKLTNDNLKSCNSSIQPFFVDIIKEHSVLPFFGNIFQQHGPMVYFNVLGQSYVLLNDPEDIKILLSSRQHINKGPEYRMLKPWLNNGLLTSENQKWQTRRKLLKHTFHFKVLESYIPTLNKHAQRLVKKLENMASNNQRVSIYTYMPLCALDVACDTIMGIELRSQEGKSLEYVEAINTVTEIATSRIFKFWISNERIFNLSQNGRDFKKSLKVLHTFTENVIKEKRAKLESVNCLETEELSFGKKRVESFLDLLIGISKQNPEQMTDLDIREEVDTFLLGGHDTSSIAITMAFIQLGLNQDIQDKLREELYSIFGDSDREATLDDLKSMKYLDRVIKETLRLYPSIPNFSRMLRQHLQIREYEIPAHSVVVVIPYLLHREEKHFPNPNTFDPDRFLPENSSTRHPYAFIPFSAGPRNCIGQKFAMHQMKAIVSTVIRKMKIETLGSQDDIQIRSQIVLRPQSLPDIKITKIK